MDTVLAPFLDTYLRNIQNAYQQMTSKILRRIKDEINSAIIKKHQVYKELTQLADKLEVPGKHPLCISFLTIFTDFISKPTPLKFLRHT